LKEEGVTDKLVRKLLFALVASLTLNISLGLFGAWAIYQAILMAEKANEAQAAHQKTLDKQETFLKELRGK
jgi:type II secretory pathway component PulJ